MNIITHSFIEIGKMVPLLLAVYILIGFLEYRYENHMSGFVARLEFWGPVAGAVFGALPQCGFSVIISALYVKRLLSVGTLLAVYLSTSDEAVPVLLSMPWEARTAGILIVVKVVIGCVAGIVIDLLMQRHTHRPKTDHADYEKAVEHHPGCCRHDVIKERSAVKALVFHPLRHTVKISLFLFIMMLCLNFCLERIGVARMNGFFMKGSLWQPALAAVIGLIPNCFASVFLVQLYTNDIIGFDALLSGLSSAAGLGLLVLIKENKSVLNTLSIIGLLLGVSIFSGTIIQIFFK